MQFIHLLKWIEEFEGVKMNDFRRILSIYVFGQVTGYILSLNEDLEFLNFVLVLSTLFITEQNLVNQA